MNIEDMAPEEIREYAAAKERDREELTAKYMGHRTVEPAPDAPKRDARFIRTVEFEGREYPVDMRRIKSRKTMRELVRLQSQDVQDGPAMMDLMDYIFEGACEEAIVGEVTRKCGFDDYDEILRIESGILEALDLKN